ncbi:MAG TPA: hypothetical protein VI457_10205 [Methylococcaceae bacterium]|nr:hypothetical protein [Methylococcaceae bacterium]
MSESTQFILGETNRPLVLQGLPALRETALHMIGRGRLSLHILSPRLEADIFDNQEMHDAVSRLARHNSQSKVQILVFDTGPMIRDGHRLVDLARRLSSSIEIRKVAEQHQDYDQAFLVVDACGVIHRQPRDSREAQANYSARRLARKLLKDFQAMWDFAERNMALLRLDL